MKNKRKRFFLILMTLTIAVLISTAPVLAGEGNWSEPGIWCGDPDDAKSIALASNFKVSVEDMMMNIPVYDIRVAYAISGINLMPVKIDREEIVSDKPLNIIWTGRHNGFNEEQVSSFEGNDRVVNIRFTSCSAPSDGNKFYALEGVVTWTPKTKRDQDKICVVWDSMGRARLYLGIASVL